MASITHIITGLEVGGAERALYTLLSNGLEGPFRNHVVSMTGPGHYGKLLEQAGIPITCLHLRHGHLSLDALWALRAAIRAHPPQLLQGWMTHGNLAATLSRLLFRRHAHLVWNIRWSLDHLSHATTSTRALTTIGTWLSFMPDAIIYNSRKSLLQHSGLGFSDTHALCFPNGFDTTCWTPLPAIREEVRAELGLSNIDHVIGFVGRGHPDKDPSNLFNAFTKVRAHMPDAHLVAVGRDLDRFGPLPQGVILTGQRFDLPRLIQAFDIMCLSSHNEGFPNVLGEAMATAVPCVATDVGDAAMIVGETGWVVPPRDSDALARALIEAISTPTSELRVRGALARERIKAKFSVASSVLKYIALYERLIMREH